MIVNPQAKVILCYGDSNTHGQSPDKSIIPRYARNIRWPGRLQELLGNNYYIIEEGLGGRTTNLEHYNPNKQSRNGLTYFTPCLISHSPIDIVIIMLGTNDLKLQYNRTAADIANTLKLFIDEVKANTPSAKVLLVSPIHINATAPKFLDYYDGIYDVLSAKKSRLLAEEIKRISDETNSLFFDASAVAKAGIDGIHFDEQSHPALAEALVRIIKNI